MVYTYTKCTVNKCMYLLIRPHLYSVLELVIPIHLLFYIIIIIIIAIRNRDILACPNVIHAQIGNVDIFASHFSLSSFDFLYLQQLYSNYLYFNMFMSRYLFYFLLQCRRISHASPHHHQQQQQMVSLALFLHAVFTCAEQC